MSYYINFKLNIIRLREIIIWLIYAKKNIAHTLISDQRGFLKSIRLKYNQYTLRLGVQLVATCCPALSVPPWKILRRDAIRASSMSIHWCLISTRQTDNNRRGVCDCISASILRNNRILWYYSDASLRPLVGSRVVYCQWCTQNFLDDIVSCGWLLLHIPIISRFK